MSLVYIVENVISDNVIVGVFDSLEKAQKLFVENESLRLMNLNEWAEKNPTDAEKWTYEPALKITFHEVQ
jgi:hypothetical protein